MKWVSVIRIGVRVSVKAATDLLFHNKEFRPAPW